MPRGLYRDGDGWVEVDYGGVQAPLTREKYIAGRYLPPYNSLKGIAPPSQKRVTDPEYWFSRAEVARLVAEQTVGEAAIKTMLMVVEQYEELAELAKRGRTAQMSASFVKPLSDPRDKDQALVHGHGATDSTERWYKRAEEIRTLADAYSDGAARAMMLRLAADYDVRAEQSEAT